MALASRASSRAVAATPRRGPSASARASAEEGFADGDIDHGCNAALGTCGRLDIIFCTVHAAAAEALQQRPSTPTALGDGSQSPDRARQAREPSGEHRLPARSGRFERHSSQAF